MVYSLKFRSYVSPSCSNTLALTRSCICAFNVSLLIAVFDSISLKVCDVTSLYCHRMANCHALQLKMYFCARYDVLMSPLCKCQSQVSFRPLSGEP